MTRTYTGFVSLFDDDDVTSAGTVKFRLISGHGVQAITIGDTTRSTSNGAFEWLLETLIPGAADCTGAASDPGCSRTSHHPTSQSAGQDS